MNYWMMQLLLIGSVTLMFIGSVLVLTSLFGPAAPRVPSCMEDEITWGVGDFKREGWFERYECLHIDDVSLGYERGYGDGYDDASNGESFGGDHPSTEIGEAWQNTPIPTPIEPAAQGTADPAIKHTSMPIPTSVPILTSECVEKDTRLCSGEITEALNYWRDTDGPQTTQVLLLVPIYWSVDEYCPGFAGCTVWDGSAVYMNSAGYALWGRDYMIAVLKHEYGHVLGYNHGDPTCTMNPAYC